LQSLGGEDDNYATNSNGSLASESHIGTLFSGPNNAQPRGRRTFTHNSSEGSASSLPPVTPMKTMTFDESVMNLSLSADGKLALLGFTGHVLESMNLETYSPVQQYAGHRHSKMVIGSCTIGSRQRYVVSGSEDFNVYVWHATPAAIHGTLVSVLEGHSAATNDVAWCQQNPRLLVSASDDGSLRCWMP
jgi:WD40 repeat protein